MFMTRPSWVFGGPTNRFEQYEPGSRSPSLIRRRAHEQLASSLSQLPPRREFHTGLSYSG
jgi:hypothetical protein